MRLPLAAASLALAAALAPAPAAAQASERVLTIFGNDKCPADTICVRAPENDRYRIPKELRRSIPTPEDRSWATRVGTMEYTGRTGTGSCSPVGAGGWTGCYQKMLREARDERRAAAEEREQNQPQR
ncbi:hypothetical protein [Sphingomonas flavalba]|uniref:hypothetical protein n=1 Tax=Sphingomonas flavalba TaxID=2559804 RepID=UPI00109DE9E8|nr:hypothetical protein [Sphingomonas flavalba]